MDPVQVAAQPPSGDRRTRKRQALRQTISDAATRLFAERGFDSVTVDDIAKAADVSRMTVFNHFARKEDMFFDRADETVEVITRAVSERMPSESPLEAVRRLVRSLLERHDPTVEISARSVQYTAAIAASPALLSRAQMLRWELAAALSRSLAETTRHDAHDPDVRLAAELTVALWSTSYATAQDVMRRTGDEDAATAAFLNVFEKGMDGISSMLTGTELVRSAGEALR